MYVIISLLIVQFSYSINFNRRFIAICIIARRWKILILMGNEMALILHTNIVVVAVSVASCASAPASHTPDRMYEYDQETRKKHIGTFMTWKILYRKERHCTMYLRSKKGKKFINFYNIFLTSFYIHSSIMYT